MNEENLDNIEVQVDQKASFWKQRLTSVTPFSKYLAMVLFVAFPFVGFWLGINYASVDQVAIEPSARIQIDESYSKDSQHVYYEKYNLVVHGVDPDTVEVLDRFRLADKNGVYQVEFATEGGNVRATPILEMKFSGDQCERAGGEVFNTLGQTYDIKQALGTVTGMKCPCVCLKESNAEEQVSTVGAVGEQDIDACKALPLTEGDPPTSADSNRSLCISEIAVENKQPHLCDEIPEHSVREYVRVRDLCFSNVAEALDQPDLCAKTTYWPETYGLNTYCKRYLEQLQNPSYKKSDQTQSALPIFSLRSAYGEQTGQPETYCWESLCVDGIITDRTDVAPLTIAGEDVSYTIDFSSSPTSLSYILREPVSQDAWPNNPAEIMHAKGSLNPSLNGTIPVDVPGGVYILVLSATWDEGDIYSVFKIEVNSENLDKSVAIEMWINGTQQERWGALQWLKDNELYEGMLVDDMKTILGEPTSTRADGTFEYAASDYVGILVEHASGVVVSISYYEV